MATYCGKECKESGPICDFCAHYDFNGDREGRYTGAGHCRFHDEQHDPEEGCEDFKCIKAQEP